MLLWHSSNVDRSVCKACYCLHTYLLCASKRKERLGSFVNSIALPLAAYNTCLQYVFLYHVVIHKSRAYLLMLNTLATRQQCSSFSQT